MAWTRPSWPRTKVLTLKGQVIIFVGLVEFEEMDPPCPAVCCTDAVISRLLVIVCLLRVQYLLSTACYELQARWSVVGL